MIQAIGLTSQARRGRSPAVEDLSFEAAPGQVTVLLGPRGAGKTRALRLMLQLSAGRGVTLFRGRPMRRVPHPAREVGTLLGDVPGHPGRTARGHLRMLAAACGVPATRADEVLEVTGLSGLADERLGAFSRGMDRRLGLAAALLGDPHTLALDEPADGLAARERAWLYGLLRGYADQGGTVLVTSADAREAARIADRVVTVEGGRLVADQEAADFARTRLRPRVVVCSPHVRRLASVLGREFRAGTPHQGPAGAEVVVEPGGRLAVYGSSCAVVGEIAYRHGVLVHRLADEVGDGGDTRPRGPLVRADGRERTDAGGDGGRAAVPPARAGDAGEAAELAVLPPAGPSWPLRYELRRLAGLRGSWLVMAAALLAALAVAAVLVVTGSGPVERTVTGWPREVPLPPAAIAAGLLGALAFGQEFRYPALAPAQTSVPRRLGLLVAKLLVAGAVALLLCAATALLNSAAIPLLFGAEALPGAPGGGLPSQSVWALGQAAVVAGPAVGCAWAGLLAAGVFRSTTAGLVAVAAVPWGLAPALRWLAEGPAGAALGGLPGRLQPFTGMSLPPGVEHLLSRSVQLAPPPVGWALTSALAVLFCGYLLLSLRSSPR
jgi:ABC-type multidrug transport system ATPase subunit